MSDLSDFLLARIAEDEAAVRTATPSPWLPDDQGWVDSNGDWIIVAPYESLDISDEDAEHVTRWQPARVLAECDAKRRIVGHAQLLQASGLVEGRIMLRLLASPYAQQPDYRQEWRP